MCVHTFREDRSYSSDALFLQVTVFRRGRMLDPMFLSAYSITTVILDLILTLFREHSDSLAALLRVVARGDRILPFRLVLVVLGRHRRLARESRSAITVRSTLSIRFE